MLVLAATPIALCPRTVRADDPIAAEATFAEGRALFKDGRYVEACGKFELSLSLERAVGTELNLAECYVKLGRTASAWFRYREAASLAQQHGESSRAAEARDRAAKLEPSLCRLVVRVPPSSAADLVVRRDGHVVDRILWGVAVPVDPGPHTVVASQPGGESAWRDVTIAPVHDGESCAETAVEMPRLRSAPVAPPIARRPPPDHVPRGIQRTAGVVLTGLGVVGIAVGVGFAVNAISQKNGAGCTPALCTADDRAELQGAGRSADIATVNLIAGASLVAVGAALWLTAPQAMKSRVSTTHP